MQTMEEELTEEDWSAKDWQNHLSEEQREQMSQITEEVIPEEIGNEDNTGWHWAYKARCEGMSDYEMLCMQNEARKLEASYKEG